MEDKIVVVDKKTTEKRKNILVGIVGGVIGIGIAALGFKAGSNHAVNCVSLGMSEMFRVDPELEQQMWSAIGKLKSKK